MTTSEELTTPLTGEAASVPAEPVHERARGDVEKGMLPDLAGFLVIVLWGSTFSATKASYEQMHPLAFGFARFAVILLIAFGVLVITARVRRMPDLLRIRRADLPLFVGVGLCGYTFYQLGFLLGLEHTSPFSGALMISLQPLVTLAIVTLMGERQHRGVWIGVVVALVGVVMFLANNDGDSRMLGNLISFGGGVAFACYQVFGRRLARDYHHATYSAYTTLFGAIPLMAICSWEAWHQDWTAIEPGIWMVFLYMCVFPVYLAYIIWTWAIGRRGVAITGLTLLVPVVAGVFAWIFSGEEFGPLKLAGASLTLVGMFLMQQANRARGGRQQA